MLVCRFVYHQQSTCGGEKNATAGEQLGAENWYNGQETETRCLRHKPHVLPFRTWAAVLLSFSLVRLQRMRSRHAQHGCLAYMSDPFMHAPQAILHALTDPFPQTRYVMANLDGEPVRHPTPPRGGCHGP